MHIFSPLSVLHHKVDSSGRVDNFVQLDDVAMSCSLQYLNFSVYPLNVGLLLDPTLLKDFHGDFLT